MRSRDELIRDTEPFPDSVIEQLPPRGDNYVTWTHYAQRLLLYYGGYSWTPTSVHQGRWDRTGTRKDGTEYTIESWVVTGELTLGDEVYGAVGEDDSPTSAESNAFKRACAKAGIGLHLYEHYWLHERLKRDV